MKVALLGAILLIIITGAERCQVERRDSVCNFDMNQPCTYELTNSSCDVNVTVSNDSGNHCFWRWRVDNHTFFKQRERGFGSSGSHFWFLSIGEIFQRASQSFDIKCWQLTTVFGPVSLTLTGKFYCILLACLSPLFLCSCLQGLHHHQVTQHYYLQVRVDWYTQ